jgi:glycosyltransferase involved in cell wall biosynthesis
VSRSPARRLVQLGKFYPPEWGGIETFTKNLAEGLAAQGIGSEVVAFTNAAPGMEEVDGVVVDRSKITATISSQPLSIAWLVRAITRARRADAVLIHYPNVLAIAAVPFLRVPRIITYWHSDVVNKGLIGRIAGIAERYLLRRSHLVLASTHAYAEASPRLAMVRDRIAVLPIGIEDGAQARAEALPAPLRDFIGHDGRLILAVGRLVKYKGFDILVRAAALMPENARIVIVGSGPEEDALLRLIEKLGLHGRVMLAGHQPQTSLQALLQSASVYAMCSVERSEAYAIVQVEAMAHGIPIVATEIKGSGVPEVSDWGRTGALVPPGDAAALAEALSRVVAWPDNTLRQRARAHYEANFTLPRMIENAMQILFSSRGQEPHSTRSS